MSEHDEIQAAFEAGQRSAQRIGATPSAGVQAYIADLEATIARLTGKPFTAKSLAEQQGTVQGDGVSLIAAERKRQIEAEGWTPEHDAGHPSSSLRHAAMAYLSGERWRWPWDLAGFKPDGSVRDLVKAGALIAAEIDRMAASEADRG